MFWEVATPKVYWNGFNMRCIRCGSVEVILDDTKLSADSDRLGIQIVENDNCGPAMQYYVDNVKKRRRVVRLLLTALMKNFDATVAQLKLYDLSPFDKG